MAKQTINIGNSPNDSLGDPLRTAFDKVNDNFDELYANVASLPTDISEFTDDQNLIFSRDYSDLANTPFIPSDVSDLTDDQNLIFSRDYSDLANTPFIATDLSELSDNTSLLTTKEYISLTNRTLPDFSTTKTYVKPPNSPGSIFFDPVDTDLRLTRDPLTGGGIYNIALESSYDQLVSPLGTEWNWDGWDNLDNVKIRFYQTFREALRAKVGENILNAELVMHDTINDKYYRVKFIGWAQGADHNGSFTYTRELIDTTTEVGITFPDGSLQTSASTSQTSYDEIYIRDESGFVIKPSARGKYIQGYDTTIYLPDEDTYDFELGSYINLVAEIGPLTLESANSAVIYDPDGNSVTSWEIPARTTAKLIKTNANIWNISVSSRENVTKDNITFTASNTFTIDTEKLVLNVAEIPSSSIGNANNVVGEISFDSSYFYYCTQDYDGVTNIWKRVAWSGDTW